MKKQRNGYIELLRFIASLAILSGHAGGAVKGGWEFVEFFFILTGYFVYDHVARRMEAGKVDERRPLYYSGEKMKKLLPYTTVTIIIYAVIEIFRNSTNFRETVEWILFLPINLIYLPATNVMPKGLLIKDNMPTHGIIGSELWYVCTMIVMIPVMMYILIHFWNKKSRYWFLFFFPMFLYGLLIHKEGTITGWHDGFLFFIALDMRGLAGMLVGGAAWEMTRVIEKYEFTTFGKCLLTFGELAGFGLVLFLAVWSRFSYEAMNVLLFLMVVGISFSGKTFTSILNHGFFVYLGKISLPLYCIHLNVIRFINLMGYKVHEYNFWKVYLLIIFVSIVFERAVTLWERIWKIMAPKMRSLIIKE